MTTFSVEILVLNMINNSTFLGSLLMVHYRTWKLIKKILEIRTAIKKWKYRFLTPTGRACVAKTLLLSKMSHIAFVIPSLNKHKLKSIENEIYQFMWKGSDKVKRKDAKQSEILGGLNVPDVISSWKSFKISWFRRLESSKNKNSWKYIFAHNMLNTSHITIDTFLTTTGTLEYNRIAKNFPNLFWTECLQLIKPFMLEHLKMHPEDIITFPI